MAHHRAVHDLVARAAALARGAIAAVVVLVVAACGVSTVVPPYPPAAAEAALAAGVDPATLLVGGEAIVGVTERAGSLVLVEIEPLGDGTFAAKTVESVMPYQPGTNQGYVSSGRLGPVLFGTASPEVTHVVVSGLREQVGGDVHRGMWAVLVPAGQRLEPFTWAFLTASGEDVLIQELPRVP